MLRILDRHLTGKYESPYAYGVSRLIIGLPSSITTSWLIGVTFWEAKILIALIILYWLHRLVQIARRQGRSNTLTLADHTTMRFAALMTDSTDAGLSKSPRLNQEWPDQHQHPGAIGQSRAET